jgi:hypothetical protein
VRLEASRGCISHERRVRPARAHTGYREAVSRTLAAAPPAPHRRPGAARRDARSPAMVYCRSIAPIPRAHGGRVQPRLPGGHGHRSAARPARLRAGLLTLCSAASWRGRCSRLSCLGCPLRLRALANPRRRDVLLQNSWASFRSLEVLIAVCRLTPIRSPAALPAVHRVSHCRPRPHLSPPPACPPSSPSPVRRPLMPS